MQYGIITEAEYIDIERRAHALRAQAMLDMSSAAKAWIVGLFASKGTVDTVANAKAA